MKKNGFTLIELLAVIVILAIIALIATPIILGIINDAREKANERSVELYASAVRNGIAAYQLREGKEVAAGTYNKSNPLPFEVEYDGKVDCTNVIISEDNKVSLDKCTVNGGTKEYSYGIEKENAVAKVCTIEKQDESKYSIGDVVTCNIGETPDKFYVIEDAELTATTIQMLTEKNIHTTEYKQNDDAGSVDFSTSIYWFVEYDESDSGENEISPQYSSTYTDIYDIYDSNADIVKPIVDTYVSYLNDKLINVTGSLLTYNQAANLGCSYDKYSCSPNAGNDLLENPAPEWVYSTDYWLGSAFTDLYNWGMWNVDSDGYFDWDAGIDSERDGVGVRPVITISTSDIQ